MTLWLALVGALSACGRESANGAPVPGPYDAAVADAVPKVEHAVGLQFKRPPRVEARSRTEVRHFLELLDVDLPGLDGHSLHERLRVERPGAFSVVFQSAHGSETEQLRALTNGALDYVVKPLNLRVFLAKVPIWLRQAGADPAPV